MHHAINHVPFFGGNGWNKKRLDIANILPHAILPVTENMKTEHVNTASKALWITPLISACLIAPANTGKLGHKSNTFLSSSVQVFLLLLPVPPSMAPKWFGITARECCSFKQSEIWFFEGRFSESCLIGPWVNFLFPLSKILPYWRHFVPTEVKGNTL